MLSVQSPVTGTHLLRPKTGRRPLQPLTSTTITNLPPPPINNTNQKLQWIEISEGPDKENRNQNKKQNLTDQKRPPISNNPATPVPIEQFEVSLADELIAIREKKERLRLDKEKTEKMLKERELMIDLKMKEMNQRGEIQKVLEIEVDRLYRLNQIRSVCNRIVPIRSLREKEREKIKPDASHSQASK